MLLKFVSWLALGFGLFSLVLDIRKVFSTGHISYFYLSGSLGVATLGMLGLLYINKRYKGGAPTIVGAWLLASAVWSKAGDCPSCGVRLSYLDRITAYGNRRIQCKSCAKPLMVDHRRMRVFFVFLFAISAILGLSFGFSPTPWRPLGIFVAFLSIMALLYPAIVKFKGAND